MEREEEVNNKDKKIRQLESKLSMALNEARSLNNSTRDFHGSETSAYNQSSSNLSQRNGNHDVADEQRFTSRNASYRRPSHFSGSENGGLKTSMMGSSDGIGSSEMSLTRNRARGSFGKRSSVSDNAISRLTVAPPTRSDNDDDKFVRGGSSACIVQ